MLHIRPFLLFLLLLCACVLVYGLWIFHINLWTLPNGTALEANGKSSVKENQE